MPLNKDAVAAAQRELVAKNSGGGDFIRPSKLAAGEHDFRILPPLPHMNGIYFVEEQVWWINQKPYVSAKSFDKNAVDVIAEEIEAAKAAKDPELDMLLNATAPKGGKMVDLKTRYIMPVLMLEADDERKVKENKAQVLDSGPQLMMNINRIVSSGRINDVTDPDTGRNLVIVKTGSGKDTEYGCNAWGDPSAIDHKWLKDMPDVTQIHEENRKSDEHLRSVICNYLYGDPIIEDNTPKPEKKVATPEPETPAPAARTRARAAAPAAEPAVTPRTRTRTAATAAAPARNILNDINSLDDDK